MPKITIVEDDEDIRALVSYALTAAGFDCVGFESGWDFFRALERTDTLPSLVLLDIMLPDEDGLSLLKRLRGNAKTAHLPVIMLTAKGSEIDKVKGLDLGADDYIAKPFGVTELISRINAVLRRTAAPSAQPDVLCYQEIRLDDARRAVTAGNAAVTLTFKEYELLKYLLLNADIVLSRDKIMESVWGYGFAGESRTVNMHIKTLRQKLGTAGEYIRTIRNVGYKIGE
ncbi:MAG: response regulator transcription factor [Peptococcaceae bacterium]|jgi:two-component system alkaline phosphatase synthesis response regulator PhoP|nr:response regulator transcription factor [Peptococcaceae bacterium]